MTLEQVRQSDKKFIIGMDEVGYGCIAGPIYVCAFLAPRDFRLKGLKDSKTLSVKTRGLLSDELHHLHGDVAFSVVSVHPNSNDEYKEYGTNVHGALKYLYWRAAQKVLEVSGQPSLIVLDGNIKFPEIPYPLGEAISLPKADALVQHVSAASVIAKVARDNYMGELGKKHSEYNWGHNKGYPTPDHLAALKKHGYCDEHRFGYEPIKSMRIDELESYRI